MKKAQKFNKTNYFALVAEIAKDVRTRKSLRFDYARIFSDPRKATNYRTKFWLSNSGAKKAAGYINKKYGKKVTAVVTIYDNQHGYLRAMGELVITPKQ
jgi:hypothetical protein